MAAASSVLKVTRRESDTAVISFAHRTAQRFTMEGTVARLGLSGVFVRDPTDSWYNAPITGLGDDLKEIEETVRHGVQATEATHVIALGVSMGGYAAILIGCRLGVERVVALYPQTLLDPIFPLSLTPGPDVVLQTPDVVPDAARADRTRVVIVSPEQDLNDAFYAARVAHLPNVELIQATGMPHGFMGLVKRRGQLGRFMSDVLEDRRPSDCTAHRCRDPQLAEAVIRAIPALRRRELDEAGDALADVVDRAPDWSVAWTEYARVLIVGRRYAEAAEMALEGIRCAPTWAQPYREYGVALLGLPGRAAEAEVPLRAAQALQQGPWAAAHYTLGLCLEQTGRSEQAHAEFAAALGIKPNFPAAERALQRLAKPVGGG